MGIYAENLEQPGILATVDNETVHEIALMADSLLHVTRSQPGDAESTGSVERSATIRLSLAASAFVLDRAAAFSQETASSHRTKATAFILQNRVALAFANQSLAYNVVHNILSDTLGERRRYEPTYDFLTGLPDQSSLRYERVMDADRNPDKKFVTFDLNFFKRVNDEFGHEVGDAVITQAARSIVTTAARYKNSTVYRAGGDETTVITESYKLEQLMRACEYEFQEFLEGNNVITYDTDKQLDTKLLLSTGVRLIGGHGNTAHDADVHMYARKKASKKGLFEPLLERLGVTRQRGILSL